MGDSTCVEKMIKINNFLTFISQTFSFFSFENGIFGKEKNENILRFSHLFPPSYLLHERESTQNRGMKKETLFFVLCYILQVYERER